MAIRFASVICAFGLTAGCQSHNPLAAFSPRIASPTTSSAPYYPPTPAAPQRTGSAPASSPRLNVSAETTPAPPTARTFVADAADRQPIRVVDGAPVTQRTASSTNRTTLPAPSQSAPPLQPSNAAPRPLPGATPQSRNIRIDTAVAPAAFQQPIPAFTESPPAPGQWRAR